MQANLSNQIAATQAEFQAGVPMGISNPLTGQDIPLPTYLTVAEGRRVFNLAALRNLFAGRHRDYFFTENRTQHEFKSAGQVASRILYITENLPGRCTLKYADLLFGEELAIEPSDGGGEVAAPIARLVEGSHLHAELFESAVISSWSGNAYLQFYMENGAVKCENVQPENAFPHYAPGTKKLQACTIKFLVMLKGERYIRIIHHAVGRIENSLYILKDDGSVGPQAPLTLLEKPVLPVQPTGIDELTVVEVPNYTAGGIGVSDYDGSESLIDEVNNRRSQISRVLDIHGDPAMMVLESLMAQSSTMQGQFRINGRAIAVDDMSKGDPVKYLTWDAQLEVMVAALVDATKAFCGQMEIAPGLLGLEGGTSADSWKKLKLQACQTLARVNRKQLFMTPAIKSAARVFFKLENALTLYSYSVGDVNLTFSDGLPTDDQETQQMITGYRDAKLMSRHLALTWIHSDPNVVAAEEAELDKEDAATLPTGVDSVTGHAHEGVADEDPTVEVEAPDATATPPMLLGALQDPAPRNPQPTAPAGSTPLA
jgi:hypothetical protein